MGLAYRKLRCIILFIAALLAIALNHTMEGYTIVFGISVLIASALTLIYLFLRFDKDLHQKTVAEMMVDGFSGLVLFTSPYSDDKFFLFVFAFWIFFQGTLLITSGLMEIRNKPYQWHYTLPSMALLSFGFIVMNYNPEMIGSVLYLIGFTLFIYSAIVLYLYKVKKNEIY